MYPYEMNRYELTLEQKISLINDNFNLLSIRNLVAKYVFSKSSIDPILNHRVNDEND